MIMGGTRLSTCWGVKFPFLSTILLQVNIAIKLLMCTGGYNVVVLN